MAKRCPTCKRTYPDKEPSCPYCAEAVEVVMEDEAPPPPKKKAPRKPAKPAPVEEVADVVETVEDEPVEVVEEVEEVEPVEVVEEVKPLPTRGAPKPPPGPAKAPPAKKPAQPTKLASRTPAKTMLAPTDVTDVVEEVTEAVEEPPVKPTAPAKGATAKGTPPAAEQAPAKKPPKFAQPTKLATRSPAPTMLAPPDAVDEVTEVTEAAEEPAHPAAPAAQAGSRAAREEVPPMELDEGADAVEVVEEAVEAETVDLGAAPKGGSKSQPSTKEPPDIDAMDLLGGEVLVEGASEVNLGETPSAKGDRPSGLDLIAEAVESGVDLGRQAKAPAGARQPPVPMTEEELAADLLAEESSSVNLGDAAVVENPFGEDLDLGTAPASGAAVVEEEVEVSEPVDEEVEVSEPVDEEVEVSEPVDEAAEEEDFVGARRGAGTAVAARPPRPRYGRRWLGGILLGILLAGGGAAAAWYTGYLKIPLLDKSEKEVVTPKGSEVSPGADKTKADVNAKQARDSTGQLAALKKQLEATKYVSAKQPRLDEGLKNLIADFTAVGESVDKKDDLPAAAKEVKALADARANAEKALDAVVKAMDKDDPLKGKVKGAAVDVALKQLGEDRNALRGTQTAAQKELDDLAGAMDKDDPLKEVLKKKKKLDQAVKALGEDRNKAKGAIDAVVKAMDKDDPLKDKVEKKDFDEAVKALGEDRNKAKGAVDAVVKAMGKTDPLKDKVEKKDLDQAVELIGKDRNGARKSLDDAVAAMDQEDDPLSDLLKGVALDKGVDLLGKDRNGLRKGVTSPLKDKKFLTKKKATMADVSDALGRLLKQAESPLVIALAQVADALGAAGGDVGDAVVKSFDWAGWSARREAQLAYFRGREPLVKSPQKMLDTWIPLLQDRDRQDARELAGKAIPDAKWVADQDIWASPEIKAKAHYVLGLALRNQLKYAAADAELKLAAPGKAVPREPAWRQDARRVRSRLTSLAAYSSQLNALRQRGELTATKLQTLLDEVSAALKVSEKGSLLAFRSQVRLDLAQLKTRRLSSTNPLVEQARADAAAAIKAGAVAAGHYALGRVAEQLGERARALREYQLAIDNHTGSKITLSRYKRAQSRVLREKKTRPAPVKEDKRAAQASFGRARIARLVAAARSSQDSQAQADAATVLAGLILFGCPVAVDDEKEPDPELAPEPEVQKAIQRAEEARKDAQDAVKESQAALRKGDVDARETLAEARLELAKSSMALGLARARNQEWKEALTQYQAGLKLFTRLNPAPADYRRAVRNLEVQILAKHPSLNRPMPRADQNALLAMKHYDLGRNLYWGRRFTQAEKEFRLAYEYFNEDARFLYFLGLSRLRQRTRAKIGAAKVDFEDAARVELLKQPDSTEEVDAALEAIQGKTRKLLNRYRP